MKKDVIKLNCGDVVVYGVDGNTVYLEITPEEPCIGSLKANALVNMELSDLRLRMKFDTKEDAVSFIENNAPVKFVRGYETESSDGYDSYSHTIWVRTDGSDEFIEVVIP